MTKHVELLLKGASSKDARTKAETIKLIEANRSAFTRGIIESVKEEITIKQANILSNPLTVVENSIADISSLNEAARELVSLAEYRWDLQKTSIALTQPLFVVGTNVTREDLSFLKEIADYSAFPSNRIVTIDSITSENSEPLEDSTLVIFLNGACAPDGELNSKLKKLNKLARSSSEQLWVSLSKTGHDTVEGYVSDVQFDDVSSFMEYYKAWLQCAVGGNADLDAGIRSLAMTSESLPEVRALVGDWLDENPDGSSENIDEGYKLPQEQIQLIGLVHGLEIPSSLKSHLGYA